MKLNSLTHRIALTADVPLITELMDLSIAENMKAFHTEAEIEAARASMGIDQTLIEDRTYFIVQLNEAGRTYTVGCGGWGKRRTLYGGDHTKGRDDSLSDPATEPARIRAMYTHPDWTRRGVGTYLLNIAEQAAREAGFKTIELGSTLPGEPLYLARGYLEVHRLTEVTENGAINTVITMRKQL